MSFPATRSVWAMNSSLASIEMATLDGYVQKAAHSDNYPDTINSQWTYSSTASGTFQSGYGGSYQSGASLSFLNGATVNVKTPNFFVGDGAGNNGTIEVKNGSTLKVDSGAIGTNNGVFTASGAGALWKTSGGGRIQLADGDYPTFGAAHPGLTPVRIIPLLPYYSLAATFSYGTTGIVGGATSSTAMIVIPARELWNGAQITSLQLLFTPSTAHSSITITNNITAALQYGTPTVGASPFAYATLGSAGVYSPVSLADYTNGLVHSLTIPCGTPTFDTGSNIYVLQITDENGGAGAHSGNVFHALRVTYSVPDLRPQ